jgi:hypothetical protein
MNGANWIWKGALRKRPGALGGGLRSPCDGSRVFLLCYRDRAADGRTLADGANSKCANSKCCISLGQSPFEPAKPALHSLSCWRQIDS